MTNKLAVIRVRGAINMTGEVEQTLKMLRLYRKNYCVVIDDTPQRRGMVEKVKDYVTFGEVDDALFKQIIAKRGEEFAGRLSDRSGKITYSTLDIEGKKYKPYFRLAPPVKGFERGGIKKPFTQGGALGNRGDKIKALIERML